MSPPPEVNQGLSRVLLWFLIAVAITASLFLTSATHRLQHNLERVLADPCHTKDGRKVYFDVRVRWKGKVEVVRTPLCDCVDSQHMDLAGAMCVARPTP